MKPETLRNQPKQGLAVAPQQTVTNPRTPIMIKPLLLLVLSLALVGRVHATTVMDSFNDVANATGGMDFKAVTSVAAAGGMGFTTGYEQNNSAVDVLRTNDLSVSLPNYVSGQSASAKHWSIAATVSSSGYARRTQTRSISPLSGTIWFSFLASLQTPNGDVALTLNGAFNGSGVPNNVTDAPTGLRIGLGSSTKAEFRGALGVGPLCTTANVAPQGEITNIINGVNGAVTAAGVVPTNGTPVLVLGKISYDSTTGYPRVDVWLNPNVANEASLPAPTVSFVDSSYNIVPTTITRIGYQVVRANAPAVQNEIIDNVRLSDEVTGFDVVYRNVLPVPVVSALAPTTPGSETGPTNLTFTITTDRVLASPLTVNYTLSGVATNGADGMGGFVNADYTDSNFNGWSSSVTIPAGKTNATVVLSVLDDALPEGNESVVLTLASSFEYILGANPASSYIIDNNDANVAAQYMFTRTMDPQVFDPHLTASTAVAPFNTAYSGAYFVSPDAGFVASGDKTPATEAGAVSGNAYLGFTLAPTPGYGMTLTNLQFQACYFNHLGLEPGATGAVVFVRSSLDNFMGNLTNWVLLPDNVTFPQTWQSLSLDLGSSFANLLGNVEFRIYFYDDTTQNQVGVRMDNLYLGANTFAAPTAQQVTIVGTSTNAAEPATPAQFTISRVGDTANPLTVHYTVSGSAANGVDYVLLPGSVTIPAGQSSAVVSVTPLDDELPESTETVVLTLAPDASYGVLSPAAATAFLADDGDIGGLVAWFFNENNNAAGSLNAVAAPSIRRTNQVVGFNAAAGPGLGLLGQNGGAGVGHGYGTGAFRSGPSAAYIQGAYVSTNAIDALTGGDYLSFTVSPVAGQALTLTNFSAWMALTPGTNQTGYAFLRSSLDNFASDLGSVTFVGTSNTTASAYAFWNLPLAMPNNVGPVEFRVYVYCTRSLSYDIIRLDDAILQGTVGNLPAGVQVVTAAASTANAAEPNTPGAFTLTRFGDTTAPLTVNYGIGGTASNGLDYATLSGTATFDAGASTVVVPVTVLNDNRPELAETVILTLQTNASCSLGWPSTATVNIADDNDTTPVVTLSATDTNAFERVSNLFAAFTLNRPLGDLTTPVTVHFTLGGTATLGVDYISSATNSVTFGSGVTSVTNFIYPIDNALVDGNRTVTLLVQSDPGFILDEPASATITIVDDEMPAANVLWSDNFDAGSSAANYTIKAASDLGMDDYVADFAFDYSTIGVPPAPHSANTTIGLKMNANQFGGAAGVNLYPNGQSFSGDFALRFDLFLSMDPGGSPDNEAVLFGINQSGTVTNWRSAGGSTYTNNGEGIFASIATRDVAPNIYNLYALGTGTAPSLVASQGNLTSLFNSPPYATAGRANNAFDSTNKTWVDCELSQVAGMVTLKLNNNVILQYTNTTAVTSGNIFLGYDDPWASLGSANCFALIDNVRVVAIVAPATQPAIKQIVLSGSTVKIDFIGGATDVASGFKLQSAATVNGTYADDASAVMTGSAGTFQATTTAAGTARFYRVCR